MRLREEFKPQEVAEKQISKTTQEAGEMGSSQAEETSPVETGPDISFDISMGKGLVILVMFAVMFALPIFIYNNRDRLFNRSINNSYTQTSISYDNNEPSGGSGNGGSSGGSVAGVSDEASVLGLDTTSVNIGTAFIVFGIGFLLLPVYFLASKR
jgi:hypothetical protein